MPEKDMAHEFGEALGLFYQKLNKFGVSLNHSTEVRPLGTVWRTNSLLSFYTNLLLRSGRFELQPFIQELRELEVPSDRGLYARTDYSYEGLLRVISFCAGPTGDADFAEGGYISSGNEH